MVVAPSFFGNVELGSIPAQEPEQLIGRVVEATLYDITGDFSHHYLKMFFQVNEIDGKTAKTLFKGHEYSRDYLTKPSEEKNHQSRRINQPHNKRRVQTKNCSFSSDTFKNKDFTRKNYPKNHGQNDT